MRDVTLCLAYYENARMLALQCERLAAQPLELLCRLELIVVDDGSPAAPAKLAADLPFRARLYRMQRDVPWNQDACRNLAAAEASSDWLLLTDMDHVATEAALRRAICDKLDADVAYTFARVSAPDFAPYKPHPNSWLLTRTLYDRAGGYDERYAGVYGTDGMFRRRLEASARAVRALPEALIRYPREVVADASTTTLTRKSKANDERKAEVSRAILKSGQTTPVRGLTPWERVA